MLAWLINLNSLPKPLRLGATAIIITAATLVQLPFSVNVPGEPFLVCYIASACCALAFGRDSGLLAIAMSAVLSILFFEPTLSFRLFNASDLIAIEAYAVIGAISVVALARMMTAIATEREAVRLSASVEKRSRLMLSEMSHRVANNFQTAAAIIRQKSALVRDNTAKSALDEAFSQIHIFASLHRQLRVGSDGSVTIDSRRFIGNVCEAVRDTLLSHRHVRLQCEVVSIPLTIAQAVPLGLIVNELVTNAVKYAFPGGRAGSIRLDLMVSGWQCLLCISDNGVGFEVGAQKSGIGLMLVGELADQLAGGFEIHSSADGTTAQIRFPAPVAASNAITALGTHAHH